MIIHLLKKLIFITYIFLFVSCAHYRVESYYDNFEKFNWTRYEDNYINENYPSLSIQINPQIWVKGDETIYSIQVLINASDWIDIKTGKNLLFYIDGNKYVLEGKGSEENRKRINHRTVQEIVWYPIKEEFIYKLAFADVIKVKLLGSNEFIQAELSEKNQIAFIDFYKKYIDETVFDIPAYAQKENTSKWFFKNFNNQKIHLNLEKFYSMIELSGWSGNIIEFEWDYSLEEILFIRYLDIIYELPGGINNFYYPEFRIYELVFESQIDIPFSNTKEFQIYPCSNCPGKFPIEEYQFLFDGLIYNSNLKINGNWMALRKNDIVYIIIGYPNNDNVGLMFGYIAQYFNSSDMNSINILSNNISKTHKERMEILESSILVQEYLQKRGFYKGKLDGLFGKNSIESLQKYLKHKKFYTGDINGKMTYEFKFSIIEYQKHLKVPETGWLNIEMAMNMR